jgi:hypothetical protein
VNQLVDEFVRTHRDLLEALRAQSPNTSGRRIAGTSSANVEWRRQMTEYIWGTMLTPAEREQLSMATDERELDHLGFDQRRQAPMEVLENSLARMDRSSRYILPSKGQHAASISSREGRIWWWPIADQEVTFGKSHLARAHVQWIGLKTI